MNGTRRRKVQMSLGVVGSWVGNSEEEEPGGGPGRREGPKSPSWLVCRANMSLILPSFPDCNCLIHIQTRDPERRGCLDAGLGFCQRPILEDHYNLPDLLV